MNRLLLIIFAVAVAPTAFASIDEIDALVEAGKCGRSDGHGEDDQ